MSSLRINLSLLVGVIAAVVVGAVIMFKPKSVDTLPAQQYPEISKNNTNEPLKTKSVSQQDARSKPATPLDPELARLLDRNQKVSTRISSDMSARIPKVKYIEDYPALAYCLTDPTDDDTIRNEVANLLSRSKYNGFADALIRILDNPSEKARFRSFAAQHLGTQLTLVSPPGLNGIQEKLRSLLLDRHVEVRREALLALATAKDPLAGRVAVDWLAETGKEADATRDIAIRVIFELDIRDQISAIRKFNRDVNDTVRIASIVALSKWYDDESRSAFEEAATSAVPRLKRAGTLAIERLDSLERLFPRDKQTIENLCIALTNAKPSVRHAAARALRGYDDLSTAIQPLSSAVQQLNGSTRIEDIIGYLDTIRKAGKSAAPMADILISLMQERSPIYNGRTMKQVHDVRGYIILALADIGSAAKAEVYILEYLANSNNELTYPYTCAAHATQFLNRPSSLVQYLMRGLNDEIVDKPVWLTSFDQANKSPATATSPRLESIHALGAIGPEAKVALPLLAKIRDDSSVKFGYLKYNDVARRAILLIESPRSSSDKDSQ